MEMQLMTAIGSASFNSSADRRSWNQSAKACFDEFLALSFGLVEPLKPKQDELMLEYYDKVIKNSAPVLRKTRTGLRVENLPNLESLPVSFKDVAGQ